MRQTINKGRVNYSPNSLGGGCPFTAGRMEGGYVHHTERVDGHKIRERSPSFKDHFTQATMFWNGLTPDEQDRLVGAAHFELGKLESQEVRHRLVHEFFNRIDQQLAVRIAEGVGIEPPTEFKGRTTNKSLPEVSVGKRGRYDSIKTRKIAVLLANGFDAAEYDAIVRGLIGEGARPVVVSQLKGMVRSADGREVSVDKSHVTTASVLFDAVVVPGGAASIAAQRKQGDAVHFIREAFKHGKAVGAIGDGVDLVELAQLPGVSLATGEVVSDMGVVTARSGPDRFLPRFIDAVAQHRHFNREMKDMVAA